MTIHLISTRHSVALRLVGVHFALEVQGLDGELYGMCVHVCDQ